MKLKGTYIAIRQQTKPPRQSGNNKKRTDFVQQLQCAYDHFKDKPDILEKALKESGLSLPRVFAAIKSGRVSAHHPVARLLNILNKYREAE